MTRDEVAIETLSAQLGVVAEMYAAAVERALAAATEGQLLQPERLDEIVRLEQQVTMLYTLLGVAHDRKERAEARVLEENDNPGHS